MSQCESTRVRDVWDKTYNVKLGPRRYRCRHEAGHTGVHEATVIIRGLAQDYLWWKDENTEGGET